MSKLTKSYEISVWDDVWDHTTGRFVEKRLGVIGSNDMTSLGKVLEPNLTRNVNGVKSLTFKMYKYYKDPITGEQVENPFVNWLVSERKVKLKYGAKGREHWYDFIVKNINENSSNYLYTYQLEDALVQELSKNGFNVVLDTQLMNNIGTAADLAREVLKDTDWIVQSEKFVQTVEENLVYVTFPAGDYYRVFDQVSYNEGVTTKSEPLSGGTALAFYSSCKNKPHRFQFIYLPSYSRESVKVDDRRFIKESNCQYYLDISNPNDSVDGYQDKGSYFLPKGWELASGLNIKGTDTTLSSWYKGKRYGYSQVVKYVSVVDKCCSSYEKDGTPYYGYVENEYISPNIVQNVITNTEFKGTSGWLGTYNGDDGNLKSTVGVKIESVYGRFDEDDKIFVSVVDDLSTGQYSDEQPYASYLKIIFPAEDKGNKGILINSGFYDNRTLTKQVDYGEEWCFNYEIYNEEGTKVNNEFEACLREVSYNTALDNYDLGDIWAVAGSNLMVFNTKDQVGNGYAKVHVPAEEFKAKNIRLVFNRINNSTEKIYYLKKASLYKKFLNNNGDIIKPGALDTEGVIKTFYKFFPVSDDDVADKDLISFETVTTINYSIYKPQYNEGAEKMRSIDAKESNYFNILQSIAETFECWVDLEVSRDVYGGISAKTVKLKNYIGKNNYANFRYGVNLKDIQRTYESKSIVTKLLVRQNSNEHAPNGFCTIARAGVNPTGESYIYDFQYFHARDMLNTEDYTATLYYPTNPYSGVTQSGDDIQEGSDFNVQNYANRIKNLNDMLKPIANNIASSSKDLASSSAKLKVQEGLRDASSSGLEEVRNDFFNLTGLMPDQISPNDFTSITCNVPAHNTEEGSDSMNPEWGQNATILTTEGDSSTEWNFDISLPTTPKKIGDFYLETAGSATWEDIEYLTCSAEYDGLKVNLGTKEVNANYEEGKRYVLEYKIQKINQDNSELKTIGSHCLSFSDVEIWYDNNVIKEPLNGIIRVNDDSELHTVKIIGTYYENSNDTSKTLYIQPNRGEAVRVVCSITDVKMYKYGENTSEKDRSFKFQPTFTLTPKAGTAVYRKPIISCTIPAGASQTTHSYTLSIVDTTATSINGKLQEYATYIRENNLATAAIGDGSAGLEKTVSTLKSQIASYKDEQEKLIKRKDALNKCFYQKYSRFIQEGTWSSEEYVDDDKYYADALSVMYNSCYPQVVYNINVISLSGIEGYEHFDFEIGDKTYVIDPEFFGDKNREEVIVTEMVEALDDPSKNTIKVQNFKNQFQDLFQKITATVQQAQYNEGAYARAVALADSDSATRGAFVTGALGAYGQTLGVAGQTTVIQDESGITLIDSGTNNALKLIGGAILMSVEDKETGERIVKTGMTPEGISASLINAGTVNTKNIQIMNADEPVFLWNSNGISAFDTVEVDGVLEQINPYKFVRFDKYGIYGMNTANISGDSWRPEQQSDIDNKATFALTWDGLKIKNSNGVTLRIGDGAKGKGQDTDLLTVHDINENQIFAITEDGSLSWTTESTPTKALYARTQLRTPTELYVNYKDRNDVDEDGNLLEDVWHKEQDLTDWYASFSYDGGYTWSTPVMIQSSSITGIQEKYFATSNPEEKPGYSSIWYDSPQGAGHNAINKYLWNYEITTYSNGGILKSDPALIATQPKNIVDIVEFYCVTSTINFAPKQPESFSLELTEEELEGEKTGRYTAKLTPIWKEGESRVNWLQVGGGTNDTIPTVEASERLWNFEVTCYDDGTYECFNTANIGTGGKGISSVQNWYQRTTTESPKPKKPTSLEEAEANWSDSVPAYNSEEGNCYLWTCESTKYTDTGTTGEPEFTDVILLSREPRNIAKIIEYYQVLPGTAAAPTTITLKNDNNEIDSIGSWHTTYEQPANGQALWNCEVIEFSTKDGEGKNLYQVVAPAKIGYVGVDSYMLSLDNDVDVIVYNNAGTLISKLPITVTASRYIGHTISTDGVVDISPPNSDDWCTYEESGKGWYTKENGVLTIKELPANYSEGNFTFVWSGSGSDATIYDQTKFSLKKIVSTVDYDLIIPQTVFNSSQSDGEYTISVLKKSENGTQTLYGPGDELKLYKGNSEVGKVGGSGNNKDNWDTQGYKQNDTTPIKYTLKSTDGSIIWDEEVIEFTRDGSSIICVKPKPVQQEVSFNDQQWKAIKTNGISGSEPNSKTTSESITWTDFTTTNNSSLRVGNSIYVECSISDKYSAGFTPVQVLVYGTITSVNFDNNNDILINFNIDSIIFGAQKGKDGSNATVNYNNIWAAFEAEIGENGSSTDEKKEKKKGIIPFKTEDGEKYLGLNADLIQTGAISVGQRPDFTYSPTTGEAILSDAKDNVFYAEISGDDNPKPVCIAGWQVTKEGIRTPNIITEGIFMRTTPYTYENAFGSTGSQDWMLGIGSKFGVTKEGNVYATGGKFGKLSITNEVITRADKNPFQTGKELNYELQIETTAYTGNNVYTYKNCFGQSGIFLQRVQDQGMYLTDNLIGSYSETNNNEFESVGFGRAHIFANLINTSSNPPVLRSVAILPSGIHFSTTNQSLSSYGMDQGMRFNENGDVILYTSEGSVLIKDLFFKGAYDIKYGSTVIGSVSQLGPIVFGVIQDDLLEGNYDTKNTVVCTIDGTIKGPSSSKMANIAFTQNGRKCAEFQIQKNSSNNLQIVFYGDHYTSMNDNTDAPDHYAYFYYDLRT